VTLLFECIALPASLLTRFDSFAIRWFHPFTTSLPQNVSVNFNHMIERYTIKFGPAVSQKELEKALHDPTMQSEVNISNQMHKMKARIEVVGDFGDLKKIAELLKEMAKP
jgi:hypothetical protein